MTVRWPLLDPGLLEEGPDLLQVLVQDGSQNQAGSYHVLDPRILR
jgi:hypothetical protein